MAQTGSVQFFAPGIPRGQPRPRAVHVNGRTHMYDPGTAGEWKMAIALGAARIVPPQPFRGPLSVDISFRFPRPKHRGSRRCVPHDRKPDIDNLAKAVLDALTDIRMWHDDSQVFSLSARKVYCDAGSTPGAEITIMR